MAPVIYKDVQNSAKNLLKDDYCFDKKFKLTTRTYNGIQFTSEGVMSAKGTEQKLTAKFKVDNVNFDKLSANTAGRFGCEASIKDVVQDLKVGLKFEDGVASSGPGSASLNATYSRDFFTLNSEIDIVDGPTLYGAATFDYEGFIAGADVKYNTQLDDKMATPSIVDAGVVLGYFGPDFSTSVQTLEKGKKLNFVLHHKVDLNNTVAAQFEIEPKGTSKVMTLGGSRRIDSETSFTGKVDSKGIVSANWIQILRPDVKLIASISIDSKNFAADAHKFGLQLVLG